MFASYIYPPDGRDEWTSGPSKACLTVVRLQALTSSGFSMVRLTISDVPFCPHC